MKTITYWEFETIEGWVAKPYYNLEKKEWELHCKNSDAKLPRLVVTIAEAKELADVLDAFINLHD
jgi:hypothetical protein